MGPMKSTDRGPRSESILLGVGLDGDGHRRVTRGGEFLLVGGSEETHEVMQEHAVRFSEELQRRGQRMDDIRSSEEFRDIADRAGL